MKVEKNMMVSIHYTLKDDEGNVLDTSDGRDPLDYIQGQGHIIPGLENALEGKGQGDELSVTVVPEEGYGNRNDDLVYVVERTQFEDVGDIQVGMQFQVGTDQGPMVMTVAGVDDENITLDGNHPLADITLNFEVAVAGIRAATEEELNPPAHNHTEGGGCC
jgi:FKBP-type peptidyl-prolyl cis-trans isomerase SlyD